MSVEEFVVRTKKLLNLEHAAEVTEAQTRLANVPLVQLEAAGDALHRLYVVDMKTALFGRCVVTFATRRHGLRSNCPLPAAKLSTGSTVDLRRVGSAGVVETLAAGVVVRVTATTIQAAFQDAVDHDLPDGALALIATASQATHKRLTAALDAVLLQPNSRVRDILFGIAAPVWRPAVAFDPVNQGLNDTQRAAVGFCLAGNDVSVIHGPPGTGDAARKTTTVVELIAQLVARGENVLACAPSNVAVDNLVERLAACRPPIKVVRVGHPARLQPAVVQHSLDALVAVSDDAALIRDVRLDMDRVHAQMRTVRGTRPELRREMHDLRVELRRREDTAISQVLAGAGVVLGTPSTISPLGALRHLPEGHFSVAVVDEAGQALEPACWVALMQASRCVLAGDHMQLPPTVLSEDAVKGGLAKTLLEKAVARLGCQFVCLLDTQYRMHASIMQWSSDSFYGGRLVAHESVARATLAQLPGVASTPETSVPLVFIDTAGCGLDEATSDCESLSKCNVGEAAVVQRYVQQLIDAGVPAMDIGVVTPYNLQVEKLRELILPTHSLVEIKSVDGFQGREKAVIIFSVVRSNLKNVVGFLREFRRMNVAITRAQRQFMCVGNSDTMNADETLASMVVYLSQHADLRTALEYVEDLCSHRPSVLSSCTAVAKAATVQQPTVVSKYCKADEITRREHWRLELSQFATNPILTEMKLPVLLSSFERRLIHDVCEDLHLCHASEGVGAGRSLRAWKHVASGHVAASSDDVALLTGSLRAGTRAEKDDRSDMLSPCFEVVAPLKALVVPNPATVAQRAAPVIEAAVLSPPSAQNSLTMCGFCCKSISNLNLDIHVVRCERATRLRKIEQCAPCASPSPAGAGPPRAGVVARLPQKDSTGNRGLDAVGENEDADDDDMLLNTLVADARRCRLSGCNALISIVGVICPHCRWTFCPSHMLPEVHGCGAHARVAAKSQEGLLARRASAGGSATAAPKPAKSPSEKSQRAALEGKLKMAVDAKAAARSAVSPAKKSVAAAKKK